MTVALSRNAPDVGREWDDEFMLPSVSSAVMVGRDADLALLHEHFSRAAEGTPTAVLVEGEAGIGKSRLLREFGDRIATRADVHVGWCLDLGSARSPYGPLTGILRSLVALLGIEQSRAAVGIGTEALGMLLPELVDTPADRERTSPERLRDAIATLIEAAADRAPQVLIVEDIHWADDSTLAMLSFLLRSLARGRILLVISCRTDDIRRGDAVSGFIGEASRARLLERVALKRLDDGAVRRLAEQLTGLALTDSALSRMQERAEGVPFFIEEIACCASGPLPDRLRDLLLGRFDRLSDDARRVVQVASGSERVISHALLSELVDLPPTRLDESLREATHSGIIVVVEDGYRFRHALLREAVHDDLLPGERSRLHRAYAEALEARSEAAGGSDAAALAYHWQLAQDDRRALTAAVTAMGHAKARYAFASAARFGELALELWPRVPDAAEAAGTGRIALLGQLGSILRNAGDSERALAVVNIALGDIAEAPADPCTHARLLRDKALYLTQLGRPGPIELLEEALAVLKTEGGDDRLRATILNHLASRNMIAGHRQKALGIAAQAEEYAERAGSQTELSVASNVRGACLIHMGDVAGGIAAYDTARERAGDTSAELRYRVNFSDTLTLLGRYREAVDVAEEGLVRARAFGVERTSGAILTQNMMVPLLELGFIERVERLLARDLQNSPPRVFRMYTTMSRVRVLAWRGRPDEAAELLREWRPAFLETGAVERQIWYDRFVMEVAVAESAGDHEGALRAILDMLREDGPVLLHQRRLLLEAGWVIAELRAKDTGVADAVNAIRSAWDGQPEQLRGGSWASILDALLAPSESALRVAVTAADGDDVPMLFRAITRLELGRFLVRDDDRAAAGVVLAEATAIAEQLGHAQLRTAVSSFAGAAGLAPSADAVAAEHDHQLTAREQQVLDLIAEGLSNRQIGERLYISVKTVSVHVSAVLRKLGVSTRTEAALAAQRRAEAGDLVVS